MRTMLSCFGVLLAVLVVFTGVSFWVVLFYRLLMRWDEYLARVLL